MVDECLIDDHDSRRIAVIVFIEPSPRNQRNSHGREKAGRNLAKLRVVEFACAVTSPRNVKWIITVRTAERKFGGRANGFYSWQCLHAFLKLAPKPGACLRNAVGSVGRYRKLQTCCHHMVGLKTGRDMNQAPKTFEQQTSADEQRERYGDFADYQRAAQSFVRRRS